MIPGTPNNLYLVHGWLVDDAIRNSMMMDRGADAQELGITITLSADGKNSFVGKHLGTVDIRDGKYFADIQIPDAQERTLLNEAAAKLKLGVQGPAFLYVVAG